MFCNFTPKSIFYQHHLTIQKAIVEINIFKHELIYSSSFITKIKII